MSTDTHLVIHTLLQRVLVRPEARVSGRQLALQAWGDLIQVDGKLCHVVPAHHTQAHF